MTVQELINNLNLIEDKELLVCIEDWNEGYVPPGAVSVIQIMKQSTCCSSVEPIDFVCLGVRGGLK